MSNSSSTNAAALRREARRRRILENSENRLRTITGRAPSRSEKGAPKSDGCFLRDFQSHDRYSGISRDNIWGSAFGENPMRDLPTIGSIFNDKIDEVEGLKTVETKSFFDIIIKKRFHYVFLSVIVQLLYFSELSFCFFNNLFCPFITLKIMELIVMKDPARFEQQSLLSILACLSKGSIIVKAWKAFNFTSLLISDFFLYIFFIVVTDKFLNFITEL